MTNTLVPFTTRYPSLFEDFRREMDGLVNRFRDGSGVSDTFSPSANVSETGNHYEIVMDLPGIDPQGVNVEMKHGDLWITGERQWCEDSTEKDWLSRECCYGRFQRMFRLGDNVDLEQVDAEYRDGVLRITVPKSESAFSKKISIRS